MQSIETLIFETMGDVYKCLIAEDSVLDRDAIQMFLSKIDNLSIEAVCSSGLEALNILQQKEIDIVLTDIHMPGLSGIELVQSLAKPPVFIFISSFSEHAAESYNLDIIDFIVKPVTLVRLIKSVNKAKEYIDLKRKLAAAPAETVSPISIPEKADHFYIRENGEYTRIAAADLLYIESMGNFSRLHMLTQDKHLTLVSLKNMESQLPASHYMRVHKQYIVNLQHIVSVSADGKIYLTGDTSIPLGDNYRPALVNHITKKAFIR